MVETMIDVALVGAAATAVSDAWALVRLRLLGTPLPDWGLVGRWVAYLPRLRFRHDPIASSPSVPHERAIGWATHYAIGIAYAALLVAVAGTAWLQRPTLLPALAVGLATALAPFLLMQPGMGAGRFGARTPDPWATRRRTLAMHAIFGLGLWLGGWAALWLHAFSCRLFSTSFC
jgi:hypothetical protein